MRREDGRLTVGDLSSKMSKLKHIGENITEQEITYFLLDSYENMEEDVDFELFLRVSINLIVSL